MSEILKPRINAAYYDFIPRPNAEDRRKLKESIIKDGVQIPIIVTPEGFILDGHTRYEICLELGIESTIPIEIRKFSDETAERKFVVMTNLARRHLNKFQRVELSWPLFEIEKIRAKERETWKSNSNLCVTDKEGKIVKAKKKIKEGLSAELYGKKIGIGKTLINQVEYLKKHASPELILRCRNNEISTVAAYDLLRGQRLMSDGKRPEKTIQFCPNCNTKTTSPKKTKCHVHKWFCCELCKWGI